MPRNEGLALHAAALAALDAVPEAPLLEVGTYCGKSAIYLGAAAAERGRVVFTVDHHRGSEENQAGWFHHDETLIDSDTGLMDTLGVFRSTLARSGLEPFVVAVVGRSADVARYWRTPLAMLFIDGGHGEEPARDDFERWTPHVAIGGTLAIHDVFPDPVDGGRPPYEQIYLPALASGRFVETGIEGSLRLLQHVG
ncbi:MAG: class I SAM-dependent methyltransferase [Acidimicrobiia bacterium]